MQDDITRIVKKPPPEITLATAKTPPAIRTKTGLERKIAGAVETEEVTVESTDGLFTFVINRIKA